jgi:proteic killer suppression protein
MIKSFADKATRELYTNGTCRRIPPDLARRARRRLEYIDHASRIGDLQVPPSNRLHSLGGDRQGQYAISINDQWRIVFKWIDGDAYDVEIADYH